MPTVLRAFVTGNYFSALGIKPALGRLFPKDEGEQSGSGAQVVLGYSYEAEKILPQRGGHRKASAGRWPAGDDHRVTDEAFKGTAFGLNLEVNLPISLAAIDDPDLWSNRNDRRWAILGRLKTGISLAQAQSEINVITARLASHIRQPTAELKFKSFWSEGRGPCLCPTTWLKS
jgi:hypothetical protein